VSRVKPPRLAFLLVLPRNYESQGCCPADAVGLRHATRYQAVLRRANNLYLKGGESTMRGLALIDIEWGNIQAGQAWAETRASEHSEAAKLCSDYPDKSAYILSLRHHPRVHIRWREAALAAAQQRKDRAAEGRHLGGLGYSYHDLGKYRRAIRHYEQRLAIAFEVGDRLGESTALTNMGVAYRQLGDHRRSIEHHEKALAIDREIRDRRGEGRNLGNLGNAYHSLGETERAIGYHEQHLVIACEMGDRLGESYALGNLGIAYSSSGDYAHAIDNYGQQLEIAREIGDRRCEGDAQWNMSLVMAKLGDRKKAIGHAETALKFYEQIEAPDAAKVRKKLERWRSA
jgi:tetratricopeptide (TPR) repeat protein